MDVREKLVEMLQVDLSVSDGYEPELIADYMLDHGVTVQEGARPIEEWNEDFGDVLWWKFPVEEPPLIKGVVIYSHRGDNPINYLEANEMKELAMDIIKMNKRGALAKDELEKMMGCKLEDMTDNQKTLGLAMLVYFESQWNR